MISPVKLISFVSNPSTSISVNIEGMKEIVPENHCVSRGSDYPFFVEVFGMQCIAGGFLPEYLNILLKRYLAMKCKCKSILSHLIP